MGAVMTSLALGTAGFAKSPMPLSLGKKQAQAALKKEDPLVMHTKLKIIEILQFIMNMRLDYRISCLLSIFRREFDESSPSGGASGNDTPKLLEKRIDLESISLKAESIIDNHHTKIMGDDTDTVGYQDSCHDGHLAIDLLSRPSTDVNAPWHRHGCVEGRSSVEHHGQRRNIPAERQTNLHRHGDCLPRHLPDILFPRTQHPSLLLFRPFV